MAYRAEIEIGVRGASRLKELQDRITRLGRSIKDVNVQTLIDRKAIQSVETYTQAVGRASANLREIKIQLDAAGKASGDYAQAISQYVTALGQSNAAQKLQNQLIADEIELRRKQKLAASGIAERTQYAGPIGPGPASAVGTLAGQASPAGERIRRIIQGRQEELQLQQALLRLEQKSATELNKKVQAQQDLVRGTQEVVELIAQANRKSRFLTGSSGGGIQGPLAGPGGLGFPVALPLTRAEQKGLENAAQKQRIIERTAKTRQELAGLAANIQRLEVQSVVAIADANREQLKLNAAKQTALDLTAQEVRIRRSLQNAGAVQGPALPPRLRGGGGLSFGPRAQGVALGAGFPLLFGGGPGAVLGGAAGGLVGGPAGFAAQIALSAIGQQFDRLGEQAIKVGQALNPLTFDLKTFAGAAGIAGTETADFLAKIEQFGGKAAAAKEAAKLLARRIGTDATKALQKFGQDAQKVGNQISIIFTTVLANIARIAGPLLAALAGNLERANLVSGFKKREGLTGREATAQQILGVTGRGGTGKGGASAKIKALGGQIGLTGTTAQIIKQAKDIAVESQKVLNKNADKALELRAIQLETESKKSKSTDTLTKQLAALGIKYTQLLAVSRQDLAIQQELDPIKRLQLERDKSIQQVTNKYAADLEKVRGTETEKVILALQANEIAVIRLETERQITEEFLKQYDVISRFDPDLSKKAGRAELPSTAQAFAPGLDLDPTNKAEQKLDRMKQKLKDLSDPVEMAAKGAQGIGDAFSVAFQGIITGTQSTQEALSNFFKGVGEAFISMATEIIAQMIIMFAFKQLLGLFGGGGGGTFSGAGPVSGASASGVNFNPAAFSPGLAFADGGFVTGPTSAVVGEGGEPEYIIPASKMRGAMNRYAAGARGSSVIPGSGEQAGGEMGGGTAVAAPIDVRYTVERINSVDYVTADQFRSGMQQAAEQGARRGEQRTLANIRQNTTTRRKLGL